MTQTPPLKYKVVLNIDFAPRTLKIICNLAAFPSGSQDLPKEADCATDILDLDKVNVPV